MFFLKRKQKEIVTNLIPNENGVQISFYAQEGKRTEQLSLPLSPQHIESYYKYPGFQKYVAWEELYESGVVQNDILSYDSYYELVRDEYGLDLLQSLGLPTTEMKVSGELSLVSLPNEGKLILRLKDENVRNLDRIGRGTGAIYQIQNELQLLPENVYRLQQAMRESYEHGYQKIGICQELARRAGIQLENFLENESYAVVDQYDLEVKVHSYDHIELIPTGNTELETLHLNQSEPVSSYKKGMQRDRYVSPKQIQGDLSKLASKRHIRGEEVPVFFENPLAVLPERNYTFDLEAFSDRVRGLIPIERVRPTFNSNGDIQWFSKESGETIAYDPSVLRTLMEQYPDEQYVQYEGRWIYLDPSLRKQLLETEVDEENKLKKQFVLDIKDNEEELEYEIGSTNFTGVQAFPVSKLLNAKLFEHQIEGYQWICNLQLLGRGGLLADDMGLGKTIQVIAFLLHQQEEQALRPTLIVLPIALIENWLEEIRRFAPSLLEGLYVHRGSNRIKSSEVIRQYNIIFTSYDTLKIDQLVLGKVQFQAIICDEAQNIKSHSSMRSRALRAMQSDFRLAMTGTPVENSLEELWAIMDFVQPGAFGSLKEFRDAYVEQENYDQLQKELQPYYLRRTKRQIMEDRLPKKHILEPIRVEASSIQKDIAASMLSTKETGQIAVLNMLMRLRQLYGHPGVIIPQYEELRENELPKLQELIRILDEVRKKDEKVIIFTEFRKLHSILKRLFMQMYGIAVPIIDGDTQNRQAVVQRFNESTGFGVMLLSPKAAGVGLTITSANHVVHYTRWWNPAVENQATDRAYRIGQQKDVFVYQIITTDKMNFPNGTVEELMHELLESKQDLAENVIIPFKSKEIQQVVLERMGMTGIQ